MHIFRERQGRRIREPNKCVAFQIYYRKLPSEYSDPWFLY